LPLTAERLQDSRSFDQRQERTMAWLPKNCVVVPFDFSEQAEQALESSQIFAAGLASLHVVHVLPTIELAEPGVIWETIDDGARHRHAEAAFRERFAETPFAKVEFHVRFGDPGREIAGFAESVHAELIVMPSHGRTGLSRLFIGSVAERVVRLAHCPVLILK
jgi:nucleotide-binding universal stress UspA family protein